MDENIVILLSLQNNSSEIGGSVGGFGYFLLINLSNENDFFKLINSIKRAIWNNSTDFEIIWYFKNRANFEL